jgi:hypothetical protein
VRVTQPRLRVLLLCDDNPANANTLLDHIKSFEKYSRHRIRTFNPRWSLRSRTLDFNEFDVIVVHWSLSLIHDAYLHESYRDKLTRFQGLKVHFLQDDYRWVDRMTAEQRRIGINVLFTLVSPEHFDKIWTPRLPGVRLVSTLPGYVPQELLDRPFKPIAERDLDIVYRGREVPWWLGRLGQDKVLVGRGVKARAEEAGFKVNIAWTEGDRIYGDRWIEFLSNSRTTIGCEGGASISDFDGSIEEAVLRYVQTHPGASFDDVHAAILEPFEGNVPMNVMTPRLFEAAALRTALVLFPGQYSNVLEPWRHYIPLERDFSNFDSVASLIRDDNFLTELTERAYVEVAKAPKSSLKGMVEEFDRILNEEGTRRARRPMVGYGITVAKSRAGQYIEAHRPTLPARVVRRMSGSAIHFRVARHPRQYAAKGYVALRATFRSRDRAGLLFRSLLARPGTGPEAVLQEMLRIDILCRARLGQLTAGQPFQTWPHLHPNGVLELRSAPFGEPDADCAEVTQVMRALEDGEVTSVIWNHSRVAGNVYHAVSRKHYVTLGLGADGNYEFRLIQQLLKSDREKAIRIIRPILWEPDVPLAAPPKAIVSKPRAWMLSGHARRLARDPRGYMVRAWVIARVIASSRGYRSVLRRYLIDPRLRSLASIDAVMGDLLRLDVLRRLCASPNRLNVHLHRDPDTGHWSYISMHTDSCPKDHRESVSVEAPVRVTWDHSAVSNSLFIPVGSGPGLKVSLGIAGIYEFGAMQKLARLEPTLVRSVLPAPAPTGRS